jgi:membrane-associated phospholipid phosphatase
MIHQFELPLIEAIQNFFISIKPIWMAITFLGDETFYIIFMPLIYWCVDALMGLRIGVMLLSGGFFNGLFKTLLTSPRPYWMSDKLTPGESHGSFGLPSGHSMNSAAVWGQTAVEMKKKWVNWLLGILIFLIGFSRLVLAVHYISDVLLGWILAFLLVWLFNRNLPAIRNYLNKTSLKKKLALTGLSSALMILLPVLVRLIFAGWQPEAEWLLREPDINPFKLEWALNLSGLWLGMLGGFFVLLHKKGILQSKQGSWQKVVRYLVGLAGVLLLYFGLGAIFPKELGLLSMILRFIRYSLIGLWISAGSALVFEKLKLGKIE